MRYLLAHKIELDCNNAQRTYFAKACGCARLAYNWALEKWQADYKAYRQALEKDGQTTLKKPSEGALRKQFNAIKYEKFPFVREVTKCAPQFAIKDLGKAFENFFRNPKHFHYPTFRKKFVDDKFTISNDQFHVKNCRIHIPWLGEVRMRESLRFPGAKLLSATISRTADRWYVSLQVELSEMTHLAKAENQGVCGVDLGVHDLAVLSNGMRFEGPKSLGKNLKKLRHLQRSLSRKKKGSHRYGKQRLKIARLHARIANIRSDALHKLTSYLSSHFETIAIEDLNVKGMLKNHHLARAISDMGFGEFRRQLEYKTDWRGGQVAVADRYYPSSRLCRHCGAKNEGLTLAQRSWVCPHCGKAIEDRDLNAAMNLRNWAVSSTATARGGGSSVVDVTVSKQLPPVKREENIKTTLE